MRLRYFCSLLVLLFIAGFSANAQVVINEYSGANNNIVPDNYGEFNDWIELYNTTAADVDITGWHLSDKGGNPTKWQFASAIVPANGYLMVWASKRNESMAGSYHTNFKLTQTRPEKIVLANPAGVIIDSLTMDPTQENHSRGRESDGDATWSVFTNPTPGSANTNPDGDYVTKPTASPDGGYHSGSVTVTLSTADAGASIFYTLDGSLPNGFSTAYSGPITISQTSVLRFIALNGSAPASFVETNTYFIDDTHVVPVLSVAGTDVEVLLNGNGGLQPYGSFELYGADGTLWDEAVGQFNEHGNDSWAYDQRGFDWITRDQLGYNYGINYQIFRDKSRDSFQRLILKPAANDNYPFEDGGAYIRDAYVQSLSQIGDLKMDERTYEPCVLYLNGQYWGVYELREKVDDHDFTDYYYDQPEENVQMIKTWGGTWSEYGGQQAQDDFDTLRTFILNNDMSIQANYDTVKAQMNMLSIIDYFALNSYTVCMDWLNWNTAWWRGTNPEGDKKKWRYFLWDMDATFGHYINYTGIPDTGTDADPCNAENLNDPGGQGHTEIMNALLANDEFHQLYVSRYIDLGNTLFSCETMIGHLDSLITMIEPEMQGQIDRWGGTYQEWEDNVQDLRDFINARCVAMNQGLVDCYEVEGPYPVTFDVDPAGSPNNIKINSIIPTQYPFEGDYFGGIDLLLDARPDDEWEFSHWSTNNHSLAPDMTTEEVVAQLTTSDTIIAHFILDSLRITLLIDPPMTGEVILNFNQISNYPYTEVFDPGINLGLEAVGLPGYAFDYWESTYHSINPDINDPHAIVTALVSDTIIAHFVELPNQFTVNVDPPGAGDVTINQTIFPGSYPWMGEFDDGTPVDFVADAAPLYTFSHWTTNNHPVNPNFDVDSIYFTVDRSDTVIAHFVEYPTLTVWVEPEGTGDVAIDNVPVMPYPWDDQYAPGSNISATATPIENYQFSHWEIGHAVMLPSDTALMASFTLNRTDTLIAHFEQGETVLTMSTVFTPNGDDINDFFGPTEVVNISDPQLTIFDRWGRKVYETNNLEAGWNGQRGNGDAPSGTYYYVLTYKDRDGVLHEVKDYFTLLR